ncbi:hypothetical protein BHM03_00040289 [Ensete ventricosum]|nr:hypothetical protein BHM03_00040289 [Ensete ventricosum]
MDVRTETESSLHRKWNFARSNTKGGEDAFQVLVMESHNICSGGGGGGSLRNLPHQTEYLRLSPPPHGGLVILDRSVESPFDPIARRRRQKGIRDSVLRASSKRFRPRHLRPFTPISVHRTCSTHSGRGSPSISSSLRTRRATHRQLVSVRRSSNNAGLGSIHYELLRGARRLENSGGRLMGEDAFASVEPLAPAFQKFAISSLRLLGILEHPDPNPGPDTISFRTHQLELDESDVVWSSSASDDLSSDPSPSEAVYDDLDSVDHVSSPSADLPRTPLAASCSPSGHLRLPLTPERCGLSAALSEDKLPLVLQHRSVATAARATRPMVVPEGRAEASVVRRVRQHQSAPVNIPVWPRWRKGRKADVLNAVEESEAWESAKEHEEEEEEEEEEMVPPHVIVARSHVTKFSVFEGVGRTLKGRDLRRVRNDVLQKTGFLDA